MELNLQKILKEVFDNKTNCTCISNISIPDRLCNFEGRGNHTGILCNSIIGCDKRSWVVCNDQYECEDRSDENQLLFDCGKYRKSILS